MSKVETEPRWRQVCERLPRGHRHCEHGHTADCPDPTQCPLVDVQRLSTVVAAGPTVWVFSNRRLADIQVNVLSHGGAKVRATGDLTDEQVAAFLAKLPPNSIVEDCRR